MSRRELTSATRRAAQLQAIPRVQFPHQPSAPGAYTLHVLPKHVQAYFLFTTHTVEPPPATVQTPLKTAPELYVVPVAQAGAAQPVPPVAPPLLEPALLEPAALEPAALEPALLEPALAEPAVPEPLLPPLPPFPRPLPALPPAGAPPMLEVPPLVAPLELGEPALDVMPAKPGEPELPLPAASPPALMLPEEPLSEPPDGEPPRSPEPAMLPTSPLDPWLSGSAKGWGFAHATASDKAGTVRAAPRTQKLGTNAVIHLTIRTNLRTFGRPTSVRFNSNSWPNLLRQLPVRKTHSRERPPLPNT